MRGFLSAMVAGAAGLLVLGCAATSPYAGANLLYSRVMTDSDGKQTPVRGYMVTNPPAFIDKHVDREENYAAADLDFIMPTFLLTFNALPGQSIAHTRDMSKAIPLLAREMCGDNPISLIERELDWDSGERKIYIECQAVFAKKYDLDDDGEVSVVRASKVDEDYVLRYRVVFDSNGDSVNARIAVSPDGSRKVEL